MGVLQRFERRLEGLVEGAFARTFGGVVQPVELAAALQREAQANKAVVGHGRVLVPNAYLVELSPSDGERLQEFGPALTRELATVLTEHAAEQGWSFVGPVTVAFSRNDSVKNGVFRVSSSVKAEQQVSARVPEQGATTAPGRPRLVVSGGEDGAEERTVVLTGEVTVLGRGQEADVQVADTGVSRRHAQIVLEPGGARLQDLQSTNGTRVNGRRVSSTRLRDGDSVDVGATTLVYRQDG
ncbi:MAG: domain containing protein [Frankiales bacterium]|nr:domain containing protein [Frankiales bacterium]